MIQIELTGTVSHNTLLNVLNTNDLLNGDDWDHLSIHIYKDAFFALSGIAFLACWGIEQRRKGKQISFIGAIEQQRYLSRIDLYKILDFNDFQEDFQRHPSVGRFIPIKLIEDEKSVYEACNAICDLVIHQFDNSAQFLPAMEWCTNEIIDNIRIHSKSTTPGIVCAQYYPTRFRLDIAIIDAGIGIRKSLSESYTVENDQEGISKALQRGVTRNQEEGQGNGLAGSHEILRLNQGRFSLWSGQSHYHFAENEAKGTFTEIPHIKGTGVFLQLKTKKPVELKDTFIGESSWTYINVECERIGEQGGIQVEKECLHTLGRETAKPLRRKIETLLTEMEEPLHLDFSNVSRVTSSFLDELLGRIAFSLGESDFHQKLKIVNAPQSIIDMANVVIHQRLTSDRL